MCYLSEYDENKNWEKTLVLLLSNLFGCYLTSYSDGTLFDRGEGVKKIWKTVRYSLMTLSYYGNFGQSLTLTYFR